MGVFDDCYCEYPLLDPALPRIGWQTKDFGCDNSTIVIRPDGTFWRAVTRLIPSDDWTPQRHSINDRFFGAPPSDVVHARELERVTPASACVRIYRILAGGDFAEVYFTASRGVVASVTHRIDHLFTGKIWEET